MLDLGALAQTLLDQVSQQMSEQGIVLPGMSYVAPGAEVAFDCEQLTVNMTRIISNFQTQDTTQPMPSALLMSSAEFFVTLVRCVPTFDDSGRPPSPADSATAATNIMRDAYVMRRSLENIVRQCLLAPRNVPQTVGELRTIGPSGGYAATSMMYTVMLVNDWWVDQPVRRGAKMAVPNGR